MREREKVLFSSKSCLHEPQARQSRSTSLELSLSFAAAAAAAVAILFSLPSYGTGIGFFMLPDSREAGF